MSKENRVSDERLTLIASGIADRLGAGASGAPDLERDIASAITELLSLRSKPVAGVEVKPLEWDGNTGRAGTAFRYVIAEPDRTIGWRVWLGIDGNSLNFFLTAKPESRDDAVSYVESDYRQRILSTLSPPAQEPVAWRFQMVAMGGPGIGRKTSYRYDEKPIDGGEALYASPQPEAVITEEMAERVWLAVLDCPHTITGQEIILRHAAEKEGRNATNQLRERITAALKEA